MKNFLGVLFIFCWAIVGAQQAGKWQDYFSYGKVLDIEATDNRLIAATENGLFYYDFESGAIEKFSKPEGLHEVNITAFAYNPTTETSIIGYQSGNLDVIAKDGKVTYVVDIPNSNVQGDKAIHHIYLSGDKALISVDYGVSIFNLDKLEFGDTCFFPTGTHALEAALQGGEVYVATNNGLYSHAIDDNFVNFSSWTNHNLQVSQLDANDQLLVAASPSTVYINDGSGFSTVATSTNIVDLDVTTEGVVVATKEKVSLLSTSGQLLSTYLPNVLHPLNTGTVKAGVLYAGTQYEGILKKTTSGNEMIKPDGPYSNRAYKLRLQKGKMWVSTGGRQNFNRPLKPMPNLGYYYYDGTQWIYPEYFLQGSPPNSRGFNILDVLPNPSDPNIVYFTNYADNGKQGVYALNVENQTVTKFIQNSGSNSYFRPVGLAIKDNLWVATVGYLDDPSGSGASGLFYGNGGQFNHLLLSNSIGGAQPPVFSDKALWWGDPTNTFGGMMGVAISGNGIAANTLQYIGMDEGLPSKSAIAYAIDQYGDLWIGGNLGLRVLRNADNALQQGDMKVEPIIIEENGLGEELFRDLKVLAIAVDSGNRKWVSIDDAGVFYLSPDGQQTLLKFTAEDSPLPSNTITDIQVDEETGKVYFTSVNGIVSYQGDVAKVTENFGEVVVYPNPVVFSQFKGEVTIKGLAEKTNIRITDAAGNLVRKAVAHGGVYYWDLQNNRGKRVASGIYFVLMTNADGTDKKAVKIAVVN